MRSAAGLTHLPPLRWGAEQCQRVLNQLPWDLPCLKMPEPQTGGDSSKLVCPLKEAWAGKYLTNGSWIWNNLPEEASVQTQLSKEVWNWSSCPRKPGSKVSCPGRPGPESSFRGRPNCEISCPRRSGVIIYVPCLLQSSTQRPQRSQVGSCGMGSVASTVP